MLTTKRKGTRKISTSSSSGKPKKSIYITKSSSQSLTTTSNPFLKKPEEGEFFDAESHVKHIPKASQQTYGNHSSKQFSWFKIFINIYRTLYLLLNIIIVALCLVTLCLVVWFIYKDIDNHIFKYQQDLLSKKTSCEEDYFKYNCGTSSVRPALIKECEFFKECAAISLDSTPIAQIIAKSLAIILNSFLSELSYKAIVFTVFFLLSGLVFNALFNFQFRDTTSDGVYSSFSSLPISSKKVEDIEFIQEAYESSTFSSKCQS